MTVDDPRGFDLSSVFHTVAEAVPDHEVLVWRDRRLTYAQLDRRVDGLARFLSRAGLGAHRERAVLAGHETGQDTVGLYLRNGNEYLESMVGSYRARCAPFNINYRYVEEELRYIFEDAGVRALVYHAEFAPLVAAIAATLPGLEVLVQVEDGSGHPLLPGAVAYEEAVATAEGTLPEASPDDLYVLFTGGTTGMPKGVLWRQDDIYVSAMGGTPFGSDQPLASYDEVAAAARAGNGGMRLLMVPPFMHGAAQWATFHAITNGGCVILPDDVHMMQPREILRLAVREHAVSIPVVGDAVALPLVEEIEGGAYDLSGLAAFNNGGAPLSPTTKDRLLAALPHIIVLDAVGSSETGIQASAMSFAGTAATTGTFAVGSGTTVLSMTLDRVLTPGEAEPGWLAQRGRVPLGYLGDAEKTARTFPVVDGVRYAVPGDLASLRADGQIELHGRAATTINSGGEKVFAEEVERAMHAHPDVADVVVVGRPHERWGSEVVAIVQVVEGSPVTDEEILEKCGQHVAPYKVPKAVLRCRAIQRSPSGKSDYRWARAQVTG